MDKMSGGEPGLHFEVPKSAESLEPGSEKQSEKGHPAHQEVAPAKAPPTPVQQVPQVNPPTAQPAGDGQTNDATQATPTVPPASVRLHAADSKLIEKEWVQKSKEIISKTRNDPFTQKNEMSRIKADYIQKRFDKHIKSDDAVTV